VLRPVSIKEERHPGPAEDARRVLAHFHSSLAAAGADIAEVRRQYAARYRPLIAELDEGGAVTFVPAENDRPALAVIRPAAPDGGPLPALVFFHGSGWTFGDLDVYEPFCRRLANATGCAVVWVEYRLAPEHPFPAPLTDVRTAYRWIIDNAWGLGLDAGRIGVVGDEAGGNLAAVLCLAERDERGGRLPWVQVLLCPSLDMSACMNSHKMFASGYGLDAQTHSWYRHNYAPDAVKPCLWRLSPLFAHDVKRLPPAVILYAGYDILRDEAEAYANRLEDADVPLRRLYFPDMIHGFVTMGRAIAAADTAIHRIAAALRGLVEPRSSGGVLRLVR